MAKFRMSILMPNGENQDFKVATNQSLLRACLKNKVPLDHSCDGNATCGTCRVEVLEGSLSPETELERKWRRERCYKPNERLACQCFPTSNLVVRIK